MKELIGQGTVVRLNTHAEFTGDYIIETAWKLNEGGTLTYINARTSKDNLEDAMVEEMYRLDGIAELESIKAYKEYTYG